MKDNLIVWSCYIHSLVTRFCIMCNLHFHNTETKKDYPIKDCNQFNLFWTWSNREQKKQTGKRRVCSTRSQFCRSREHLYLNRGATFVFHQESVIATLEVEGSKLWNRVDQFMKVHFDRLLTGKEGEEKSVTWTTWSCNQVQKRKL